MHTFPMCRIRFVSSVFLLPLAALSVAGCGPEPPLPVDGSAMWAVPASFSELAGSTFFDHPWPSDLRLEDGKVPLATFPNPRFQPIIDIYKQAMDRALDGFSPAAAGYLRFTAALDPSSLPRDPLASLSPASAVQLIDIDPDSPDHGKRRLVTVKFREAEGVYYPTNTLAWMPALGFPLRPHTRYALVVTGSVRTASGGLVEKSKELAEVLGEAAPSTDATSVAKEALAPAVSELAAAGLGAGDIVSFAVFRTNDPTEELFQVHDHLRAHVACARRAPGDVDARRHEGRVHRVSRR